MSKINKIVLKYWPCNNVDHRHETKKDALKCLAESLIIKEDVQFKCSDLNCDMRHATEKGAIRCNKLRENKKKYEAERTAYGIRLNNIIKVYCEMKTPIIKEIVEITKERRPLVIETLDKAKRMIWQCILRENGRDFENAELKNFNSIFGYEKGKSRYLPYEENSDLFKKYINKFNIVLEAKRR